MSSSTEQTTRDGQAGTTSSAGRLGRALWQTSPALLAGATAALLWVVSYDIIGRDAYYPRALCVVLLGLAVWNALGDVLGALAGRQDDAPQTSAEPGPVEIEGGHGHGVQLARLIPVAVVVALFVPLVSVLGFVVASGVVAFLVPMALGRRRPLPAALFAVTLVAALYFLFVEALGVRFATGWWS